MPVKASSQAVTSTRMSITPRGCLRSKPVAMFMMVSLCRRVGKSVRTVPEDRARSLSASADRGWMDPGVGRSADHDAGPRRDAGANPASVAAWIAGTEADRRR
jgi:hypothetical protein